MTDLVRLWLALSALLLCALTFTALTNETAETAEPVATVESVEALPRHAVLASTAPPPPDPRPAPVAPIQAPSIAAAIGHPEPTAWPNIVDDLPFSTAPTLTPLEADQQAWEQGYVDSGADPAFLATFWRPSGIVDCETGYWSRPSDTGDHGYAQVNQIHRDLVVAASGNRDWRAALADPYWNGYVSGLLVKRKTDRGSNPWGDWYRSGHCHGLA